MYQMYRCQENAMDGVAHCAKSYFQVQKATFFTHCDSVHLFFLERNRKLHFRSKKKKLSFYCNSICIFLQAMTVCKDLGVNRAKFMSSGSYFRPKDQTYSGFSVIYLHCGEDDDHLLDCYIDNRERKCESEGSAGVICSEN